MLQIHFSSTIPAPFIIDIFSLYFVIIPKLKLDKKKNTFQVVNFVFFTAEHHKK